MKKILLSLFLFAISIQTYAQKKEKTRFGIQSGINISNTLIYHPEIEGELFLGSSFGFVARQFLVPFRWKWGPLKMKTHLYLDVGLNAVRQGYIYNFNRKDVSTDIYSMELPIVLVLKSFDSITMRRATQRMAKKKVFYIAKYGLVLSKNPSKNISRTIEDNSATHKVIESSSISNKINASFLGAGGIQKEMKNGAIYYLGLSFHQGIKSVVEGNLEVTTNGQTTTDVYEVKGSYFSIDLQHFFGKRAKATKQDKVIIYNPRFL